MAITDTRPTDDVTSAPTTAVPEPTGLAGLLGTGDHKAIGRLYVVFAVLFGLASLVAAALSRLENVGDGGMLPEDTAFQVFTLGEFGLVFLFAIPLFAGLAIYLTPLQVGAATIAFPRAAALSFWLWLAGGITAITAWALNGGPGGGSSRATDLSIAAWGLVVMALLLAAVCIATTVVTLRTEGMSLDLVPMFSWSMLAATAAWTLSLPLLLANLIIVFLNNHNANLEFASIGSDDWTVLVWAFLLPQVYVCAIPVLGVVGDVVPSLSGVRQTHRGVVMAGIGAFATLAIGGWAQPAQGGEVWAEPLFIAVSFLIVLPVLACLGAWGVSLAKGTTRASSGLILGLAGIVLLLVAALAGALFSVEPFQVQSVVIPEYGVPVGALGQSNLVLGAALAGAVAALFFWGPKITGRALNDGLGKLVALLALVGALAWGVAPVVQGFQSEFSGLEDAADALTVISVGGAAALALALLVTALGLLGAAKGDHAPDDAWGTGQTLEWATACPPPKGNFGELAPVRSPEPVLDANAEEVS